MKRLFALLLALMLLAGCALAEEKVAMRIVSCPEQGFSTLCKPEYDYDYTPDGGLALYLGEDDDAPCVTISKTDAPGVDFDYQYYLTNVYGQLLESYGDEVTSPGEVSVYSLGGKELPGRMATYAFDGQSYFAFCAYDLEDDYFVRYEAFSRAYDIEIEDALTALAVAVGNFRPDENYYKQ